MNIKKILLSTVVGLLGTILFGQSVRQKPNIIIILADDLGYGDVSAFNPESKLHTRFIDQMASEGMMFTDAHTSSSVCTPTRYSILTGRYNWRSTLKNGVLSGFSKALIQPDRMTISSYLKDKGYFTGFIGKWHLGWDWAISEDQDHLDNLSLRPKVDYSKPVKNGPESLGFEYSYGFSGSLDMPPYVFVENSIPTAIPEDTTVSVEDKGFWRKGLTAPDFDHTQVLPHIKDKAIAYIENNKDQSDPFFLYLALPAPHTPILPTTEFLGKSNTNFYGDFVLQVDHFIGEILDKLKESGIDQNTMVIFTSDNGCSPKASFQELARVGHDPSFIFRGHKADIYEGGHRVPFIVRWPAVVGKNQQSTEVICTTDFLATIVDLFGEKLPDDAGEDSYSFLPVLEGSAYQQPLREATVHHSIAGRFAIRQGDWKLILWPGSGGWSFPRTAGELEGLPAYQLYNLKEDLSEEYNLVGDNPDRVKAMRALLADYVVRGRSTPGVIQQNDGGNSWEQLGWMED